jgi:hypothetical protein
MLTRPELAVVNPLPRARVQPSIRNRHTNTRAHQTALNVPGHIIQPLVIMPIQHALFVLRRKAVQRISHVSAHSRVGVLVEREGARSVLDEEVHDANFEVFELGELACDFVRDEVTASGFGGQRELLLEERHAGRLWKCRDRGLGAGGWRAAGAGWEFEGGTQW